ncbi:hypothetical protein [uncultured Roseibium sp.]|uniref:hypothetical protein n=1 Tax=uncultured Roseibium sp. TaxID=1936171 RepID=UPI002607BCFB|nr:hypothetical protein [uncultured Roseibium sp.]
MNEARQLGATGIRSAELATARCLFFMLISQPGFYGDKTLWSLASIEGFWQLHLRDPEKMFVYDSAQAPAEYPMGT